MLTSEPSPVINHWRQSSGLKPHESREWAPIITDSSGLARRAREAIEAIAHDLITRNFTLSPHPAPRRYRYEEALLYGYLAVANDDPLWGERAVECLNQEGNEIARMASSLYLHSGLCGLGWTMEHLARLLDSGGTAQAKDEELKKEEDILTADLVARLVEYLQRTDVNTAYDLVSGLVGMGIYFLECCPNAAAVQGVRMIFERLESLACHADGGVTWHTGVEQLFDVRLGQFPNGYYDLGVAHGVPGVIHFLWQVSNARIVEQERVHRLLDGAVDWLIAQQLPSGAASCFPCWIASQQTPTDSRLAWCYGDLGIVAVLLQVAGRADRTDWHEFAYDLLGQCLARQRDQEGVADAPLCHGAAGLAHIFNRIYQSERDPRCREASLMWFERALAMRQPASGIGGFSSLTRPDAAGPEVWEANPAFLDGATGIALALLAAVTQVEPGWDRLLLLSGRTWGADFRDEVLNSF